MAHKNLSYYLDNLSRLEEITVEELHDWQNEYPYVQNLKFLVAKKQQQISKNPDKDKLQLASVYSADRAFLYTKLGDTSLKKHTLDGKTKPKSTSKSKVKANGAVAIAGTAAVAAVSATTSKKKKKAKIYTVEDRKKAAAKSAKKEGKKSTSKGTNKKIASKKKPAVLKYHNLKKVEGIGPKIEKLLYASNIRTYKQLAAASQKRLTNALAKGGSRYKSHNPTTWPKQAELAAADKWDQLKKLQDKIVGGKIKSTKKSTSKKTTKAKTSTPKKTAKTAVKKVTRGSSVSKVKKSTTPKKKAATKAKVKKAVATKTVKPKSKKTSTKKSTTKKKATKVDSKKLAKKSKAKTKKSTTPKSKAKKKIASPEKVATKGKSRTKSKKKKTPASKSGEEVSSFSQWLMSLRNEEKKQKPASSKTKKAGKAAKANKTTSKTDRKIKASLKSKDQVVSESLAKLLAKQGHHAKAKSMYKKLGSLFPAKKSYFNQKIAAIRSKK